MRVLLQSTLSGFGCQPETSLALLCSNTHARPGAHTQLINPAGLKWIVFCSVIPPAEKLGRKGQILTATPDTSTSLVPLEAIFSHALDAVIAMNSEGQVVAWNPVAEALFGWTAAEAKGQVLGDLIVPPAYRKAHAVGLKRYLETGDGPVLGQRISIEALRRDGNTFPVELAIVAAVEDDTPVFIGFLRSVEEQKQDLRARDLRTQEAEVLASIAAAQLEDATTDEFITLCLTKICEVTEWEAGHLYVLDAPDKPSELLPTGNWYMRDSSLAPIAEITRQHRFRLGEGLPGRVWQDDDMIIIDNLVGDPNFKRAAEFVELELTKAFAFPIRRAGRPVAVAEFFGKSDARSDTAMRLFVRAIAGHVGMAIQRKEDAEQRALLERESAHRVANSLAVLHSIFRRCCQTTNTVDELSRAFEPRLMALSHAHRLSGSVENARPDIRAVIEAATELLPDKDSLRLSGPDQPLPTHAVMPLALVFSELVTNTLKYGASDRLISVLWEAEETGCELTIHWHESPVREAAPRTRKGYGSTLIDSMIRRNLRGSYTRKLDQRALEIAIHIPLAPPDESLPDG
ncbi:PAS domain S-box protein [Maricaulis sp. CAU 1757]